MPTTLSALFSIVSRRASCCLPFPNLRNALITFTFLFLFYSALYFKVIVRDGDMDTLRIGTNKNEVFNVGKTEMQPYGTLILFGLIPLAAALYFNYFFLNPINLTPVSAGAQQNMSSTSSPIIVALSTIKGKLTIFSVAIFATCYSTLYLLSTFALVCNYPLSDMTKLCTFTGDVLTAIAAKHGKDSAWIIKGSLIGALRANKKHNSMVLNDHDFDICYDKRLEPVILETVKAMDVTYERVPKGPTVDTDLIRIYPRWVTLMAGHSGPNKVELEACTPQTTKDVVGCNGLLMPISTDYDAWLTKEYGADWRTPKTYNHGGLCTIFPTW